MTKVVFFDVDGTLLSHKLNAVPRSARRVLEELKGKGVKRVAATGRHKLELDKLPVRDIDFDGYITLNGQLCLDGEGSLIAGNPITGEEKEHLLRLFRDRSLPLMLVEQDTMYLNFVNEHVVLAQQAISTPIPPLGEYMGNEIYMAVAFVAQEDAAKLTALLPGCKITEWNQYGIDIISRSGGKAAGIRAYLEHAGIGREGTMAFGDGENDIEMLEYVHTGVAMGNGGERLKACADYVTASVEEDGIEKAARELNLIS